MKDIKLVALDLDGTLFDNSSHISERNLTAIRSITDKGIHVVISTGRPFEGIPFDQIKGTGINYAITANGSGIYEISTGKCLYENAMDEELVTPILNFLLTRDIHMDAFIGGKGYTPIQCVETAQKLTQMCGPQVLGEHGLWFASETFCKYLNKYPGALGFLGIANPDLGSGAAHHNSRFDVDESALLLGVCAELSFALR